MAFNEERLGDIVFLCQVDAGLRFLADRRERRNFGLLVVPTAKQLGQFRFHFGGGEIAPHRHQHVVREEVTPVESDDVAASAWQARSTSWMMPASCWSCHRRNCIGDALPLAGPQTQSGNSFSVSNGCFSPPAQLHHSSEI